MKAVTPGNKPRATTQNPPSPEGGTDDVRAQNRKLRDEALYKAWDHCKSNLSHRGDGPNRQFLVRWKHYGPEDASWVKVKDLKVDKLIKRLFSKKGEASE